jgi:predicted AlkP superfamily phosphohydrolase/phosphomutase
MEQSKPTLIMIGLDGATFDVIAPLVEMGHMPNLGRLMAEGAYGSLESIIPPITGPAWSVLATGKNPGQLGTFDFINRRTLDDYRLYPIRTQELAGQTFWDVLSQTGSRVGILNYPNLVPAYPVNGWMVAGLGASKLHDYAYPVSLKEELDRVTGDYVINVSFGLPKYQDNLPRLVEDLKDMLRKRLVAMEHMLETEPVDLLVAVFTVSDVASHTLWAGWETGDQEQPLDERHQEMREAFISIWEEIDQAVGQVMDHLAPEGHALVVSDHGFGPTHGVFHVNQWLREEGYLARKAGGGSTGNRLREWVVKTTTPVLGPVYKRMLGSKAQLMLRASVLREIDLDNSKAFALENSDGYAGIFVNRQYAEARGLDVDDFVRETSTQLRQGLEAWSQENGLSMQVFLSEELYSGEKATLAPEVLALVDNYRSSVTYRLEGPIFDDRPHHPMKSGSHRLNGILLATGPRIMAGRIEGAQLQDIAPTMLSLADAPLPVDIDGRVLVELLRPEYRTDAESGAQPAGVVTLDDIQLSEQEEEDMGIVLQRLVDLGYLD